jgi:hypothetical protein
MSMRMAPSDISRVKKLAKRLGVRDSDVIRFAVKGMLERFWPLCDSKLRGQALIPLFVESGTELVRFFEIDATRLGDIINDGAEPARHVEQEDVVLLALSGSRHGYAVARLGELQRRGAAGAGTAGAPFSLRDYLYEKYLYGPSAEISDANAERLVTAGG